MAFNGTGTYIRLYNWQTDKANGVKIRADRMDGEDDGFATGLSTCITKDGQTTVTANIPMATFKITGLGAATTRTDAARGSNLQDNDLTYFTAAGTDTYTLTPSPAVTAYTAGQGWLAKFTNANTGNATLNVSGVGAKALVKNGTTTIGSGDISAGMIGLCVYDGTSFQMFFASKSGMAQGGEQTSGFTAVTNTRYRVRWSTAQTITFPASPTAGDEIEIAYATTAQTTLGRNGNNINNVAADFVRDPGYFTEKYTYNATAGWC